MQDDGSNYNWFDTPELREADEITQIIIRFSHELLRDDGEAIVEFHFGCAHDRIEWDDQDFSHMEIAPPVIVSLDFEELGKGRFNALTPEDIQSLLFRGRYRRGLNDALRSALHLERKRVVDGLNSELHLPEIRKHMNRARNAILASFRFAERRLVEQAGNQRASVEGHGRAEGQDTSPTRDRWRGGQLPGQTPGSRRINR